MYIKMESMGDLQYAVDSGCIGGGGSEDGRCIGGGGGTRIYQI